MPTNTPASLAPPCSATCTFVGAPAGAGLAPADDPALAPLVGAAAAGAEAAGFAGVAGADPPGCAPLHAASESVRSQRERNAIAPALEPRSMTSAPSSCPNG